MTKVTSLIASWLDTFAQLEDVNAFATEHDPQRSGKVRSRRHRVYVSPIDYPLTF